MNKLILALTAALIAGSAMAEAPKTSPATGVEKSAAAPKTTTKAHHHKLANHHKVGSKAHRKPAA